MAILPLLLDGTCPLRLPTASAAQAVAAPKGEEADESGDDGAPASEERHEQDHHADAHSVDRPCGR